MILTSQKRLLITAVNVEFINLKVRKILFRSTLLLLLFFRFTDLSAQDSCSLRISLLTCSPGTQLYSTFGHSAIRVVDNFDKEDIVFNYGTFDFSEPNFYVKFIRGKLLYYLSTENYSDFEATYKFEERGITEQVLNLSCAEREKMYSLLKNNLQGENKFYKYDFFFDNCTTRLRDLLVTSVGDTVIFKNILNQPISFRQMLYQYLNKDDHEWSKLGIDLLLGIKSDKHVSANEIMFLPDYLMTSFDSSSIGKKNVVAAKSKALEVTKPPLKNNIFLQPLFIFSLLLAGIVILSFSTNIRVQESLNRFDSFLFFITGLTGIFLLLMWFGTDHSMFADNLNIVWALPTHVIAAFYMNRKTKNIRNYLLVCVIIYATLLFTWNFLPQHFNTALVPVILLLLFRSIIHLKKVRYAPQKSLV
ncbi:DUF4105 domain-containing protein [soil metagenome]